MANHTRRHLTLSLVFLFYYIATVVIADSTRPESYYKAGQHPSSYYPEPQDFPNEKLYQAYFVIQRFKKTISRDPRNITSTWSGHDICSKTSYLGFYCATLPGSNNLTVTSAIFSGFGLRAPKLQGFIDQLPDLALFEATSNNFGGEVPILTGVTYLYKLNIGNDQQFQLSNDGVGTSHISARVCVVICFDFSLLQSAPGKRVQNPGATNGKALLLNNNILSGPIPKNIGLSKLSYLALANNKLIGSIPSSIAHAQDTLLEVLLLNNQLSGCLPHELGLLNNAAVIDAGMNKLTGPIPASFSCLISVEQLNLATNHLYGEVPDALCKLAGPAGRLANLTLAGNYFTSVGPACSALIKDGVLDVKNNCIPGFANQRRPAECASFLSQPKTCPAAISQVSCPVANVKNVLTPKGRNGRVRRFSSYVTYATLHA